MTDVTKKAKAEPTQEKPKDQEKEDLIGQLQRLQAEFQNYQKRIEREAKEFKARSELDLLKKILPIVDNFKLALDNASKDESFKKGMELIFAQLEEIIEDAGIKPIGKLDEKFDPNKHEALLQEESKKEKNTIIEVLQTGYELNGKIIRTAKVKVAR